MIGRLLVLAERAAGVVDCLPAAERADGNRLLALCQDYAERASETGTSNARASEAAPQTTLPDREAFIRELSRLVEYLARRSNYGIPLAALGRAVLAHDSGHQVFYAATCNETEQKLGMLGF